MWPRSVSSASPAAGSPSQSSKVATARKRPPVTATGTAPPQKVVKVGSDHILPSSFSDDQLVTSQPSELCCIKCKKVPRLPKRSKCCNTLYCDSCSYSPTAQKCPVHRSHLEFFIDTKLKNRIAKWTIYCENKCGWKGIVQKLEEHLPVCTGVKVESTCVTNTSPNIKAGAISFQSSAKTSTTSKASSITIHAASPSHREYTPLQPSSTEQLSLFPPTNIAIEKSSLASQLSVTRAVESPIQQSKSSCAGHKSSSVSIDTLYSELKGISAKWHKLGGLLKIGQLEKIRALNGNNPERCLYALLKEFVGMKGGSPYKKLCKALESDIISEKSLVERLRSTYGSVNVRITLKGGEAMAVAGPSVCDASSVTITHRTMSTTHLHTKTTTISPPQPLTVGGAFPGEGGATGQWRGMDVGQGPCGTSAVNQFQQPLNDIRYRSCPSMDLLCLIKYIGPHGREHTLKLVDELTPVWKRMGHLLGISTEQLNTWERTHWNPSNCSERVLEHFLHNGSHGTYVYPRTWGGIIKLLQDLDLKNISEKMQSIAH